LAKVWPRYGQGMAKAKVWPRMEVRPSGPVAVELFEELMALKVSAAEKGLKL
jgi:hypothetical protein